MCKYSMRVTEHYGYICIGYALVLALGILFFAPKEEEKKTIGVIENGKLIEVYEENKENKHERNEGNIYVGIVKDIIPGMQAAFIDIGTEKKEVIRSIIKPEVLRRTK